MTHASLFSGIGGFDLPSEWMGWTNAFSCEVNPFGRRVLEYYWPEAIHYEDITTTDFSIWRGRIDILTGGFPCQPYSTAGKRLGTEDDRHLWPEMLRAIREIKPTYVVGENVRGLISWNGGLVFDEVQTDLETEGYEVQPFLLPACAVNAPHRRDRIWFVAYHSNAGTKGVQRKRSDAIHGSDFATHPCSTRRQQQHISKESNRPKHAAWRNHEANASYTSGSRRIQNDQDAISKLFAQGVSDWRHFPTQFPLCDGDDGLPTQLDGITLSRHRRESIKAGGNAIVPQVALQIFKALIHTQQLNN